MTGSGSVRLLHVRAVTARWVLRSFKYNSLQRFITSTIPSLYLYKKFCFIISRLQAGSIFLFNFFIFNIVRAHARARVKIGY